MAQPVGRNGLKTSQKALTGTQYIFLSFIARKKSQKALEEKHDLIIQTINDVLLSRQTISSHKQELELSKLRISKLRQELESQQKALDEDREAQNKKKEELLPRARNLAKAQNALVASKHQLHMDIQSLEQEKILLEETKRANNARRWQLIRELKGIYVIEHPKKTVYTINGISLPHSEFTGYDEDQIATALGYVCHLLFMSARYLQLPVRYPMSPMCSRSIIRDDISQQNSPKFPLYSRGVDRTRFEYAVFFIE